MKRLCERFTKALLSGSLASALAGCATTQEAVLPDAAGALEARQVQSRCFDSDDPRLVLKAVLNVLQDEGFVVREASAELGVVTAVREWQSRQVNSGLRIAKWIAAPFTYGATLLIPTGNTEYTAVEANVNVTGEAARTRVRVSLVSRTTDREGRVQRVSPVDDAGVYQRLLARLDKAVYLQREGL
jgi:hypothetical protein